MSEEQLKAFIEKVKIDKELQEKFNATTNPETAMDIAKEAGFFIQSSGTVEIFNHFWRSRDAAVEMLNWRNWIIKLAPQASKQWANMHGIISAKPCFIVNIAKLAIIDQIAKQSCLQPPNGACKSLIHAFKLLIDYQSSIFFDLSIWFRYENAGTTAMSITRFDEQIKALSRICKLPFKRK